MELSYMESWERWAKEDLCVGLGRSWSVKNAFAKGLQTRFSLGLFACIAPQTFLKLPVVLWCPEAVGDSRSSKDASVAACLCHVIPKYLQWLLPNLELLACAELWRGGSTLLEPKVDLSLSLSLSLSVTQSIDIHPRRSPDVDMQKRMHAFWDHSIACPTDKFGFAFLSLGKRVVYQRTDVRSLSLSSQSTLGV